MGLGMARVSAPGHSVSGVPQDNRIPETRNNLLSGPRRNNLLSGDK